MTAGVSTMVNTLKPSIPDDKDKMYQRLHSNNYDLPGEWKGSRNRVQYRMGLIRSSSHLEPNGVQGTSVRGSVYALREDYYTHTLL